MMTVDKTVVRPFVRRSGRPLQRANISQKQVGMSFRFDPRLKNLLIDIADGYDMSITELIYTLALKESGIESLEDV